MSKVSDADNLSDKKMLLFLEDCVHFKGIFIYDGIAD